MRSKIVKYSQSFSGSSTDRKIEAIMGIGIGILQEDIDMEITLVTLLSA